MNGPNPPAAQQDNVSNRPVSLFDVQSTASNEHVSSGQPGVSNSVIPSNTSVSVQGNLNSVIPSLSVNQTNVIPSPPVNQAPNAATSVSISPPKTVVTDRVNPDLIKNLDSKSRTFELKEFMKNGWLDAITKKFKSIDIATQNITKSRTGKFSKSLLLHFSDSDPELADQDFKNSEQFTLQFNDLSYSLKAFPDAETDGMGTIIPRVIKQAVIRDCPYGLIKNTELFSDMFGQFFDVDFVNQSPRLIRKNGVFTGSCHIFVKNFKIIPPRKLQIPAVRWCTDKKEFIFDEVLGSGMVRIECKGFDPSDSGPEKMKIGYRCRFCSKHGHFGRDCPQNNLRDESLYNGYKSRCPVCKRNDSGCHRNAGLHADFTCLHNPNPTPAELKDYHLNKVSPNPALDSIHQSEAQTSSKTQESTSVSTSSQNVDLNPNNWQIMRSKSRTNAKNFQASVQPPQTTDSSLPPVVDEVVTLPEQTCLDPDVEDCNEVFDLNLIDKKSPRQSVINLNPIVYSANQPKNDSIMDVDGGSPEFNFDNPVESDSSSGGFEKSMLQLNLAHEKLSQCLDGMSGEDDDY